MKNSLKILTTTFGLLACAVAHGSTALASEPKWDLNDVSLLSPLPKTAAEMKTPFRAAAVSDQGLNFIPRSEYDEILATIDADSRPLVESLYSKWTAIGFRIDSCFHEHFNDPCEKQVRVAWQPLSEKDGKIAAESGALHTFYPISDREWPKALKAFREIQALSASLSKKKTAGLPLGIHPGFGSAGLSGTFAKEVFKRLKPWILQSRIRVISMALPLVDGETVFKRFQDWGPTAKLRLNPLWITYNNELEIRYANASAKGESTSSFLERQKGSLNPLPLQDDLRKFLADSNSFLRDREALIAFADIQRRIIDPTKHSSLSVDCLSCHMSGAVGGVLSAELTPAEKARMQESEFANPGNYNLKNVSARPGSPIRVRAFGYEGTEVSILDRTIYDSAEVAEALNRAQAKSRP